MHQNLFGAWLQNVAENLTRELPRRAAANRRHLDHFAPLGIAQRCARSTANRALDAFGLRNWSAQAKSDVVGKVRTAERKDRRVLHCATLIDAQAGCLGADI